MKKFHAHLYFRPDREPDARALYALAENRSGVDFELWKFYPLCVGPHALPMMEFHFTERTEAAALDWLTEHHGAFSVLIHEETGADVRDHEINVRWLGNPLPIHFEFFEQVADHPHLAIHPQLAKPATC